MCCCWPVSKGKRGLVHGLEAELGLALPAGPGKIREGKEGGPALGFRGATGYFCLQASWFRWAQPTAGLKPSLRLAPTHSGVGHPPGARWKT